MSRVIAGLRPRKRSGREESPDSSRGELARVGHGRATRLVTPGGCADGRAKARFSAAATESATENRPPVMLAPRRQAFGKNRKPASFGRAHLARVKRWGKSPPLQAQARRHGKPHRVQGQIGDPRSGPLQAPHCGPGPGYWLLRQMILSLGGSSGADKIRLTALPKSFFSVHCRAGGEAAMALSDSWRAWRCVSKAFSCLRASSVARRRKAGWTEAAAGSSHCLRNVSRTPR